MVVNTNLVDAKTYLAHPFITAFKGQVTFIVPALRLHFE